MDRNEALAALPESLNRHRLEVSPKYRDDGARMQGAEPVAVFAPRNAEDCSEILKALQAAGQPCVVQGGRTGLSGGARVQPGEAVLSLERLVDAPHIDETAGTLLAGAGIALETAQNAASATGLYLAADLGARGTATLGGMASTNAGGPLALRYGTFRNQVLGLEAVLADGTIVRRLGGLRKDNSGYDLTQLLIGSEGTLGVITRVVMALHPAPPMRRVAVCALDDVEAALAMLKVVRAQLGPALQACELIIEPFLSAACVSQDLVHPFPPGAGVVLLIEVAGSETAVNHPLEAVLEAALENGIIQDAVLSSSEADCQRLWRLREGCSHHISQIPATTGLDISLPISAIPAFLAEAQEFLSAHIQPLVFGHLGDGNLHYILPGRHGEDLLRPLFQVLVQHNGVITAEHGIGLDKVKYLGLCRAAQEIEAMGRLKAAIDPGRILNPGRVFAAGALFA